MARYYGLVPSVTKKVDATPLQFLIGAGIGLLGIGALKFALLKLWPATKAVPAWLPKVTPVAGALALGFLAFLAGTKMDAMKDESRAMAHLVGAGVVGLSMSVWPAIANSDYGRKMGFAGFRLAGVSARYPAMNGVTQRQQLGMGGVTSRPQSALQGFANHFAEFADAD